jgi:hypothetical protein
LFSGRAAFAEEGGSGQYLPGSMASFMDGVNQTAASYAQQVPSDGSVLPFPPVPSPSSAGPTVQESTYKPFPPAVNHLKNGAPNVLIILMDDVGFGTADTCGGKASAWEGGVRVHCIALLERADQTRPSKR